MDHHEMNHENMNHEHMNHDGMDHSMHMGNFKKKFWWSLGLALPIFIFAPMMGITLPFQMTFKGSNWLVAILGTVLFIYGGEPFLIGAKNELKQKSPGMMTLIAMGISVAYFYSMYAFVLELMKPQTHVMDFFWELASLIVIMLLGHWIEMNAVMKASGDLKELAELLPSEVTRITEGKEEKIPLKEVKKGDHLLVKSGENIPADGVITKGSTYVNEAAVTGESKEVKKEKGDTVIGGGINGNGAIEFEVKKLGEEAYLGQIMSMVKKAQQEKSKLESLSDKVAKWLFYFALAAGILTFIVWLMLEDFPSALERMVTVFVIACPHALGLAIPLVIARSTSLAAKNGLLLKNRQALESGADVAYVLLDKTGTLTNGEFSFQGLEVLTNDYEKKALFGFLGALEKTSNHPLALSIMKEIKEKNYEVFDSQEVKDIPGQGLKGQVKGRLVEVMNEQGLKEKNLDVPKEKMNYYEERGNTISFLVIDGKLQAFIALGDDVKSSAKEFIQELKQLKITPVMLTGDNQKAAESVARYLNISEFKGNMMPKDKEKVVAEYLEKGKNVLMVGDGINDAPALSRATIGLAIGAGTDIAIDAADVILTNSNPKDILHFLELSKNTHKKMIQNLWWGAGYNIVAIPLAAGILSHFGILLSPAVGAILMSLSTVIVAMNALTLKIK